MSKRRKRKRRGHFERKPQPKPPMATVDHYGGIQTWTLEPVMTVTDLLRRDQPNPPVVVR